MGGTCQPEKPPVETHKDPFKEVHLSYYLGGYTTITHKIIDTVKVMRVTHLDLSENLITEIPGKDSEFYKTTTLTLLNLEANKISNIPLDFGGGLCNSLLTLNLKGNNLENLPITFSLLRNLNSLNLSCNKLKSLPHNFGELSNLKILHLDNNQLQILPISFRFMTNLHKLELYENRFTSLLYRRSPQIIVSYFSEISAKYEIYLYLKHSLIDVPYDVFTVIMIKVLNVIGIPNCESTRFGAVTNTTNT
jgi:hypothetical protein